MQQAPRSIVIGGEAGQGLVTIGDMLVRTLIRSGYGVLVAQHYMSRVRGGHNTYNIRVGAGDVLAPTDDVHVLVALDQRTVTEQGPRLGDGLLILDERLDPGSLNALRVPFAALAGRPLYENIAALGVLAALLGLERAPVDRLVGEAFHKKGDDVITRNLEVLEAAWRWASDHRAASEPLSAPEGPTGRMMLQGNEAIALGALAAGVKFCAFYPMTPATSVAQNLILHAERMGVVVEQAEDEIAAMNMVLGASYAGARALVPTSGGGFALMTEGVSLAGVMEQPVVIVLAQRPGPATGLPTRTEQADLDLALYAGHGEFPRVIFAPATPEDCFHLTYAAFDLAERFQIPAFVLTDQYLADSYRPVAPFDLDALPPLAEPDFSTDKGPEGDRYKRYELTESGISPRRIPGFSKSLVLADCHEHTEQGYITEDAGLRIAMSDKRLRKGDGLRSMALPPRCFGDEAPDLLLACWGSSEGAVVEAAQRLRARGRKVGVLSFTQVWPLEPSQFLSRCGEASEVVCIEGNATGQFSRLLRLAGVVVGRTLLRYDGRPFTPEWIVAHLAAGDSGTSHMQTAKGASA